PPRGCRPEQHRWSSGRWRRRRGEALQHAVFVELPKHPEPREPVAAGGELVLAILREESLVDRRLRRLRWSGRWRRRRWRQRRGKPQGYGSGALQLLKVMRSVPPSGRGWVATLSSTEYSPRL